MNNCPNNFICINQTNIILIFLGIIILVIYYNYITKNKEVNILDDKEPEKIKDKEINEIEIEDNIKIIDNNPQKKTNIIYSNKYEDNYYIKDQPLYTVNKNLARVINPLLPPERSNPYTIPYSINNSPLHTGIGLPINIPTRGYETEYSQIGVLTNNDNNKNTILPLYGRPLYPGSTKWLYYTSTDKFNSIKIPINYKNRNCTDDIGCDEINNNDELNIPAYNNKFNVSIYNIDKPKYIPYVV